MFISNFHPWCLNQWQVLFSLKYRIICPILSVSLLSVALPCARLKNMWNSAYATEIHMVPYWVNLCLLILQRCWIQILMGIQIGISTILHDHIMKLKERHLPVKYIKYNRHKHRRNKWTTNGIIRSIRYRDNMYKVLKQTDPTSPPYEEAKGRLQCYNKILKKAIRETKVNYYENVFNTFNGDARKMWKVISEIISRKITKRKALWKFWSMVKLPAIPK